MTQTLRASLAYEPKELQFGTSGRRGLVADLTQLEIYINATSELEYLLELPPEKGGIRRGEEFFLGHDLRPSSTAWEGLRGQLAQAIWAAVADAGLLPVNLGALPTPALTLYAISRARGSMMITGSHIPFDRNGYKANSSRGELLKADEEPIGRKVAQVRARIYAQNSAESRFDSQGVLKSPVKLPAPLAAGALEYRQRYESFLGAGALSGLRVMVYQHSAVGRDLLVELLEALGATVFAAGRSETFVPIDTEAIGAAELAAIEALACHVWQSHGAFHAVVSTDGDSDRPLVLSVSPGNHQPCQVRFYGGDLLGMIVAEALGADAVVVPISTNDAIDRGALRERLEPKTRIGSPYVIAGMEKATQRGARAVCGWEANGGFLLGSKLELSGRSLAALPTRDALLPILMVLQEARGEGWDVAKVFERLPQRFSRAALLRNFPRTQSRRILESFSPPDSRISDVVFETSGQVKLLDAQRKALAADAELFDERVLALLAMRDRLGDFFTPDAGFGSIRRLNYTDGLRISFFNGDVAHVRPSGNAEELRIYAVADTQERADQIAALGVAEPAGILRQLQSQCMGKST